MVAVDLVVDVAVLVVVFDAHDVVAVAVFIDVVVVVDAVVSLCLGKI